MNQPDDFTIYRIGTAEDAMKIRAKHRGQRCTY